MKIGYVYNFDDYGAAFNGRRHLKRFGRYHKLTIIISCGIMVAGCLYIAYQVLITGRDLELWMMISLGVSFLSIAYVCKLEQLWKPGQTAPSSQFRKVQ